MKQWQPAAIPITGGIDLDSDPRLSPRPQELKNCRYAKLGSLTKRLGTTCITGDSATPNARMTNALPPGGSTTCNTPETICTFKDRLLRIGKAEMDSLIDPDVAAPWAFADYVSECRVTTRTLAANTLGVASGGLVTHISTAVIGTTRLTAWVNASGQVQYTAERTDTGALIRAGIISGSGGSFPVYAMKVVGDTGDQSFGVFFSQALIASAAIKLAEIDATSLAVASTATLAITIQDGVFDVDFSDDLDAWVIAYSLTSGTNRIQVRTVANGGALGTAATLAVTHTIPTCFSIRCTTNRVWLVYAHTDGTATIYARGVILDKTTLAVVTGPTLLGSAPWVALSFDRIGINETAAGDGIFAWTYNGTSTWSRVSSLFATLSAIATYYRTVIVSRPFQDPTTGRSYVWCVNQHSVQGTYFLMDIGASSVSFPTRTHRIAAVAAVNRVAKPNVISQVPNGVIVADVQGGVTFPILTSYTAAADFVIRDAQIELTTLTFTDPQRHVVETPNHLLISGGVAQAYDGQTCFELGFAYPPDMAVPAAFAQSTVAGTFLTTTATYGIRFTYAWTDATGARHRSAPSAARSTLLTGTNNVITGTAPTLQLTNKYSQIDEPLSPIGIEVWRTAGNGSVYYLDQVITNNAGSNTVAFTCNAPDTTLTSREILYTTGGALENVMPGGGWPLAVHQNAIVVGADDGTIWLSKPIVTSDGFGFNEAITLDPFTGGSPTGFATLNELLVVFKLLDVFVIAGQMPAANGQSTLADPQLVQADGGCIGPRSIVSWGEGIGFQSQSEYQLLTRALQVLPIGRRIEALLSGGAIVSTSVVAHTSQVRVCSGLNAFDYDYRSGNAGDPMWTRSVYKDGLASGGTEVAIQAACIWQGLWTRATSDGRIFQEVVGDYRDRRASTSSWVTEVFTGSVMAMATLAGFGQVRRIGYVGEATECIVQTVVSKDSGFYAGTTSSAAAITAGLANKQVHVLAQKGQFFQVTLFDQETVTTGNGMGLVLQAISAEVSVDPKLSRQLRAADRNA